MKYKIVAATAATAALLVAGQGVASASAAGKAIKGGVALSNCDGGGQYIGSASTSSGLGGTFSAGFCTSGGKVRTATDDYHKTSGSAATGVAFTWRFTNGVQQHTTAIPTIHVGDTWGAQGHYSGISIPSGSCMQGVLYQHGSEIAHTPSVCN